MTAPQRIQLRRVKGWRKPAGAVVVARPTCWGNPFQVRPAASRKDGPKDMWGVWWAGTLLGRWDTRELAAADAVDRFRRAIIEQRARTVRAPTLREIRAELAGRDLACWCPLDRPCHADVLLVVANADDDGWAEAARLVPVETLDVRGGLL